MRCLRPALFVLLAAITSLAVAGEPSPYDRVTEIIATHRPAEELLPVLMPLAGSDVSVQAYHGQLIIGGPAARVEEMLAVLADLDRPSRNLRISVRRLDAAAQRRQEVQVRVQDGRASVGIDDRATRSAAAGVQQLVMLEGEAARLSLDSEIPVLGTAPSGATTTGFLPLGNALELRPTLAGERVRLEIRRRDAQAANGAINAQTVQSVLLLEPGVWTELGAVAGQPGGASRWEVMVEDATRPE